MFCFNFYQLTLNHSVLTFDIILWLPPATSSIFISRSASYIDRKFYYTTGILYSFAGKD